jgi:hypothetical protein
MITVVPLRSEVGVPLKITVCKKGPLIGRNEAPLNRKKSSLCPQSNTYTDPPLSSILVILFAFLRPCF